jgi:hypothetical protein
MLTLNFEEKNMINYYQFVPDSENLEDLKKAIFHVKEHLSSVADADDDPLTHADRVRINLKKGIRESNEESGTYVYGSLDSEPVAAYLSEDFDPEDDIKSNPLSVPSVLGDEK